MITHANKGPARNAPSVAGKTHLYEIINPKPLTGHVRAIQLLLNIVRPDRDLQKFYKTETTPRLDLARSQLLNNVELQYRR